MMKVYPIFLTITCTSIASPIQASDSMQKNPYLPPTPDSSNDSFFIDASWIYWQANETGLGYAMVQEGIEKSIELMHIGTIANPHFEWNSGFQLGVGYKIPHDRWQIGLRWTNYNGYATDAQASPKANTPSIYPSLIHSNAYTDQPIFSCQTASCDLDIHLNILDLDIGKHCKLSPWLTLRPHVGIRATWLDQTYDVNYADLYTYNDIDHRLWVLNEYQTHMINNFFGIGIECGVESEWAIKWGLSLYANITGSLLYGSFSTSHTETYLLDTPYMWDQRASLSEDNPFHAGRAIADMQLGLRWTKGLAKNKVLFLLQAGWEQHCFFSQNQFLRFVDGFSWGNFVQNQGDIYFQGWSASTGFYF